MPGTEPLVPVVAALPELLLLLLLPSFATSAGSTFTEFSALILVFLAAGPAALLFSSRDDVKFRIEELSYSSSSSSTTSSDSSSESESAPRTLMLSKSSFDVRAPSRVSDNDGETAARGLRAAVYACG
ncbi:UNVERIFIED_CONTAM: hypothetical protein Sradi_1281400 [Sesamum radiatum]|uniref:Secreted protein n=1 Tax=Sesamum radiatum TaxID=300843 RepID=A0AAW2UNS2_SESRA